MKKKPKAVKIKGKQLLQWFEVCLGVVVLLAVVIFTGVTVADYATADWTNIETFLELLKTILQLAIGVEIARLLFSYSLATIIELAVFVVARKLLLLEDDFVALLLGIIALVILFAARHYFMEDDAKSIHLTTKTEL